MAPPGVNGRPKKPAPFEPKGEARVSQSPRGTALRV